MLEVAVNNIDLLLVPAAFVGLTVLVMRRAVDPLRRYAIAAATTVLVLSFEYLVVLGLAGAKNGLNYALAGALFFAPQIVLLPLLTAATCWTVQFEGRGFKHWRPTFLLATTAIFHFWTRQVMGGLAA
jgi:hypothetical protein